MDRDQDKDFELEQSLTEIGGSLASLWEQVGRWHPDSTESQRERLLDLLNEVEQFQKELEAKLLDSQRTLQFEPLLASAARDLGQPWLDLLQIRQQHAHRWYRALEHLEPGDDFETEARRIVEQTLLGHDFPLPITGRGLIETFDLAPGYSVTELLKHAYVFYKERPCSAEQLLRRLEPWAVEFGGSPAASRTVAQEPPPPEVSLWQKAILYASATTLFDKVERKDGVAEGILQQFLRPKTLPALRRALSEDDRYRSGSLTLLLYLVANYIKNCEQPIDCKNLLGGHPRWTSVRELRRRLNLLERTLARAFDIPFTSRSFRRTHLRGKLGARPGNSILITLSSEFHHLFRHHLILKECFMGPRPVLVVNYHGREIGSFDLSVVGEDWMTFGPPDRGSDEGPHLFFTGAPTYLPPQVFGVRFHDGGFQVRSVSKYPLYNALNAESAVVDLKPGESFRIGGLVCRLSES